MRKLSLSEVKEIAQLELLSSTLCGLTHTLYDKHTWKQVAVGIARVLNLEAQYLECQIFNLSFNLEILSPSLSYSSRPNSGSEICSGERGHMICLYFFNSSLCCLLLKVRVR